MEREEVRAAAAAPPPRASGDWGSTRLPALVARPGNVGVQIDAFRSMTSMFHRPRCGQFTARFLGLTFESSSMDNYPRIVERTAKRAQLLEAKLAKLRAREQQLEADEAERKARRREREAARQRRRWQQLQAMKRQDERARETDAALAIQRRARGMAARRRVTVTKRQRIEQHANSVLRRALANYALRCRRFRQEVQAKREAAAAVLQRRARLFARELVRQRRADGSSASPASTTPGAATPDDAVLAVLSAVVEHVASEAAWPAAVLLVRDISLDVLFSDDEDDSDESPAATAPATAPATTPATDAPSPSRTATSLTPRPPPPAAGRATPRRPARVRRVGGGFGPSSPRRHTSQMRSK